MRQTSHKAISEPPEGVFAGESVPHDSEPDSYDEDLLQRVEAQLKARGEPFATMSESELRERALEFCHKYMED